MGGGKKLYEQRGVNLSSLCCLLYAFQSVSWPAQEQAGPHLLYMVPLAIEYSLKSLITLMTSTQAAKQSSITAGFLSNLIDTPFKSTPQATPKCH